MSETDSKIRLITEKPLKVDENYVKNLINEAKDLIKMFELDIKALESGIHTDMLFAENRITVFAKFIDFYKTFNTLALKTFLSISDPRIKSVTDSNHYDAVKEVKNYDLTKSTFLFSEPTNNNSNSEILEMLKKMFGKD